MPDPRVVGPILAGTAIARAVAAAICEHNPGAQVDDRGGYLRVSAPPGCSITRAAIEAYVGAAFVLPGDLERVMTSFRGRLTISEERARWD